MPYQELPNQTVTFDTVVPDGQAMARWREKALFVPGLLPGETAEVTITRNKKTWANGEIVAITEASDRRHEPAEAHYLSCSPWQSVDYAYQVELKTQRLTELFGRQFGLELEAFVAATSSLGYRNKLEFSVETSPYGELGLAFHARGSYNVLVPAPTGCVLGSDAMNQVATGLVATMQKMDLADFVDTLTVRQSRATGDVVAVVALRAPVDRNWPQLLAKVRVAGMAVVLATGHHRYETVWSDGETSLAEEVGGVQLSYPWDGFFQVNVPVFEQALSRIVAAVPAGSRVVDLYGGVGTIGLAVSRQAKSVLGVEIVAVSVELAMANARAAGITNYEAVACASERMDPALLEGADVVVVDPPRAGLDARVVQYLLAAAPATIIYLSCNPITQARDLVLLRAGGYEVGRPTGFDFYPGTLHLESLVVLTRR